MKCFVIYLLLAASLPAWAVRDERELLKCLGEEEKRFHLNKETGPLYDLNQRLISEMIQIPKAELNTEIFKQICSKPHISPSLKLLELSISKGKSIFEVKGKVDKIQQQISDGMIDDYIEATREIFLNFLTHVQTQAPTATCLKEEIPKLATFLNDIKYLQEDIEMKQIFANRDKKIFLELKNYPQAFERCRARLKKKLKSESTVAPKKS